MSDFRDCRLFLTEPRPPELWCIFDNSVERAHIRTIKVVDLKGAGLFQRAGQTMKQAGAKGTSRYLIGIKS